MKHHVPDRGSVIRRASSFFGFAFVWSAAVNILPQLYLLEVAPEHKGLLLSSLLLLGTVAAWAGVERSRRQLARGGALDRSWLLLLTLAYGLPLLVVVAGLRPLVL